MTMKTLINRGIFHYVFWSFTLYLTVYIVYLNAGTYTPSWDAVWFINENMLVINLLIAISKIIDEQRLKIFSYIAIAFKSLLCAMNALAYLDIEIKEIYAETTISAYWIIALIFYLYVSRKRIH